MYTSRIAIVLGSALAIAALACSSADQPSGDPVPKREISPTNPDKNNPPKDTGSNTGSNTGNQNEKPGTPAPTGGDGAACLQQANADGCFKCCDDLDPKAFDEAIAASDACLCGATGACKTQCANSVCKGNEPDAQCQQCLGSQAAAKCQDAFMNTCNAKASCKTAIACEDKCAEKFPDQGGQGGGG